MNPENLIPAKPGEVRNPRGINQYTYRAKAEASLAKWCAQHGDAVIERLVEDAKRGKSYAMRLVLERVLPAVQAHEVRIPGSDPAALSDFLAKSAPRIRSNGAAGGNGAAPSVDADRA